METKKKDSLHYEKLTLQAMIRIYCRWKHQWGGELCESCQELYRYSLERIESCRFKRQGLVCSSCHVHCYKKSMRHKIREVMAFSGPRMFLLHPLLSLRYLKNKIFTCL
ncbi:MAG: nitrous oxide-stimulated promoter family protein [Spirochaetales bacterium]|nr:nitrous oxide-stimulated promoter family protein [Spirochaetales bacterium]